MSAHETAGEAARRREGAVAKHSPRPSTKPAECTTGSCGGARRETCRKMPGGKNGLGGIGTIQSQPPKRAPTSRLPLPVLSSRLAGLGNSLRGGGARTRRELVVRGRLVRVARPIRRRSTRRPSPRAPLVPCRQPRPISEGQHRVCASINTPRPRPCVPPAASRRPVCACVWRPPASQPIPIVARPSQAESSRAAIAAVSPCSHAYTADSGMVSAAASPAGSSSMSSSRKVHLQDA